MHTERNIVAANPSIRPMSNAGTGLNDRHIVTFSRSGRGIIVVFWALLRLQKSKGNPLSEGVKYRGWENFTIIVSYHGNCTR